MLFRNGLCLIINYNESIFVNISDYYNTYNVVLKNINLCRRFVGKQYNGKTVQNTSEHNYNNLFIAILFLLNIKLLAYIIILFHLYPNAQAKILV